MVRALSGTSQKALNRKDRFEPTWQGVSAKTVGHSTLDLGRTMMNTDIPKSRPETRVADGWLVVIWEGAAHLC